MFHVTTKSNFKIYNLTNTFFNAYLIEKDNTLLMVDTGRTHNYKLIIKNFNSIKPDFNKIDYLLLTHTHFDHCENAKRISKKYKSKVIVGKSEAECLMNGYQKLPRGSKKIYSLLSKAGHTLIRSYFKYPSLNPDILVDEEKLLPEFGDNLLILPTPGHTSGSISIIIDNEIAITGDTMFGVPRKNILPPFADQPEMIKDNWKLFLNTDCRLFLSGHGNPISRQKLYENYFKLTSKSKV